jgi:hypothetical protein
VGVLDGKHGKRQKIYASNGILEVADLLDKFSGPVSATGVPVPVKKLRQTLKIS